MQHRYFRESLTRRMLVLLIGLIVVGTALFVTGVLIEHSGSSTVASVHAGQSQTSSASQDPDGGHEAQDPDGGHEAPTTGQVKQGEPSETVFGLDLENHWFVAAFALLWVLFIAALIRFGRIVLPVLVLVAMIATVLDAGEVMQQIAEANGLLVALAGLVTVSHVALVILALVILLQGRRPQAVQLG